VARLGGGALAGFAVPTVPLIIPAPGAFWRDVVVAQIVRGGPRTPTWFRLDALTGLNGYTTLPHVVVWLAAVALVVLVVASYAWLWSAPGRRPVLLEVTALALVATIAVIFLGAHQFYWHYGGFFGAFLALALALPATRLTLPGEHRPRAVPLVAAAAVLLVLAGSAFFANRTDYVRSPDVTAAQRAIPAGACTFINNAALALAVNRFPLSSSCHVVVDGFGTEFALGKGKQRGPALREPAVRKAWFASVRSARYALMGKGALRFLPWHGRHGVHRYLERHFRRAPGGWKGQLIFVRRPSAGRTG
jgi:hypothetical protein